MAKFGIQLGFGVLAAALSGAAAMAQPGQLVIWGTDDPGMLSIPAGDYLQADVGADFCVGMRADHTLLAWGSNQFGQLNVPSGTFQQFALGSLYAVAIRSNGTLVAWGYDDVGNLDVPSGTFQKVDASAHHGVAIRTDGSVVAWGAGSANFPAPSGQFTDVAAGDLFSVALRTDGTIVAWGEEIGPGVLSPPQGQFVDIAAGGRFGAGLRADGTVAFWGSVSGNPSLITGAVRAISANFYGLLCLRADGTLTSDGPNGGIPGAFGAIGTGPSARLAIVPSPSGAAILLGLVFGMTRSRRRRVEVS